MSDKLVTIMHAGSQAEARVAQAILQASGIRAVIEGDLLQDELVAARRVVGRAGTELKVAESVADQAVEILEAAHDQGQGPEGAPTLEEQASGASLDEAEEHAGVGNGFPVWATWLIILTPFAGGVFLLVRFFRDFVNQ